MAVSRSFRTFVEEQLSDTRRITTNSMFGGIGIYSDGAFFGLIDNDTLFFKVDDSTRPLYRARGALAFDPNGNGQRSEGYYEVPAEVLEDRTVLGEWRDAAVQVAVAAKARPKAKIASAKVKPKPKKATKARTQIATARPSKPVRSATKPAPAKYPKGRR